MDDLISRQAAIDALWKVHQNRPLDSDRWVITDCLREIDGLPPAQPEPRKGKWIGNSRHTSCSICGQTYCIPDGVKGELDMSSYHYCPNCGARMEESDGERCD